MYSPPVLYYHSVAPHYYQDWGLKYLTHLLHHFEDQLRYLSSRGIRSIFLEEWLALRQKEKRAKEQTVCLTFDDGFLDNWVYAYPLAKKYGHRFTLFVNPECVDPRSVCRFTLEDVWAGRCTEAELESRGFASWPELQEMQASGLVDIQSHTMSHDKYTASPRLKAFYYGGANGIYSIWNAYPKIKPFYLADQTFSNKLPWGRPLFAEASSVIVRRHTINPDFINETAAMALCYDLQDVSQRPLYEAEVKRLYQAYARKELLVQAVESLGDYQKRLAYEIRDSKYILEEKIGKPVRFLCWPHGDNTLAAHHLARAAGYQATTAGKMVDQETQPDRIPRTGVVWRHSPKWNRLKFHYKIASSQQRQPYYAIAQVNDWKNKLIAKWR